MGMRQSRPPSRDKIIYHIVEDLVFISDIFDARQDPEKMAW